MKRTSIIVIIVLCTALVGGVIFYFPIIKEYAKNATQPVAREIGEIARELPKAIETQIQELQTPIEKVMAPPPLRSHVDALGARLTTDGTLAWTNKYREENNLKSLKMVVRLNEAATNKLQDMFKQQYFEHVNPQGFGPADVVRAVNYQFIVVGENLALGNFSDDKALVDAWMASPGHRANILNSKFQEIGIAVGQGIFEGRKTWLAVQTFATPRSACPSPNDALSGSIETIKTNIRNLERQTSALKLEIERLTNERNGLYANAERLINEGEQLIEQGNQKIKEGNRVYRETGSREQAEVYWKEGNELQRQGSEKIEQGRAYEDQIRELGAVINQKIDEYNAVVSKIQVVEESAQGLIAEYNKQVEKYNACIAQF